MLRQTLTYTLIRNPMRMRIRMRPKIPMWVWVVVPLRLPLASGERRSALPPTTLRSATPAAQRPCASCRCPFARIVAHQHGTARAADDDATHEWRHSLVVRRSLTRVGGEREKRGGFGADGDEVVVGRRVARQRFDAHGNAELRGCEHSKKCEYQREEFKADVRPIQVGIASLQ